MPKYEELSIDNIEAGEKELEGAALLGATAKRKWPWSIPFIMVNEVCERFAFYGLKSILPVYLSTELMFGESTTTAVVHAFIFGAYVFPLLGGWMADSWLGKYKTILWLSIIYCAGQVVVSVTAIKDLLGTPPHWWGIAVGLTLTAVGTGGIKPNVSAFVGDQFVRGQEAMLTTVFSMFYFCINTGALGSMFLTPVLRTYVNFFIAFLIPAIMMFLAVLAFLFGSRWYRHVPPGENMLGSTCRVVGTSLRSCSCRRGAPPFFDRAIDKHGEQRVKEVRAVFGIIKVFLPLIIFWALFDQYASRWVFQARRLDRHIGSFVVPEEQVTILSPGMLLLVIPVLDRGFYPLMTRLKYPMLPLRRMMTGMVFTALAFVAAAVLELQINQHPEQSLSFTLQIPQYFLLCIGEAMVSITGLEFAYSQSPPSMKSVIMAAWLLTVALGNGLVAIIAEAEFIKDRASEYFFFAGLMLFFDIVFLGITWTHKYVDASEIFAESKTADELRKEKEDEARETSVLQ